MAISNKLITPYGDIPGHWVISSIVHDYMARQIQIGFRIWKDKTSRDLFKQAQDNLIIDGEQVELAKDGANNIDTITTAADIAAATAIRNSNMPYPDTPGVAVKGAIYDDMLSEDGGVTLAKAYEVSMTVDLFKGGTAA